MKKNCLALAIFFVVVALTYLLDVPSHATTPDPPSEVPVPVQTHWRRTCRGWEKMGNWLHWRRLQAGRVHPLTVAALELLLSLGALVAFDSADPGSQRRRGKFFSLLCTDPPSSRHY